MQSVTLGDEEARRRGVQKSVLERKGPPTFSAAVEMISRTEWRVHRSLSGTAPVYMHLRILSASLQKFSCLVSHGGCVRRTLSKREVLQTVHWQVRLFLQSGIQCDGVWVGSSSEEVQICKLHPGSHSEEPSGRLFDSAEVAADIQS